MCVLARDFTALMDEISDYQAATGLGTEQYEALTLASMEVRCAARAPKHLVRARRSRYEHRRVGGDRARLERAFGQGVETLAET